MDIKLGSVYISKQIETDLQALFSRYPQVKRRGICSRIFEEGIKLAKRGQVNFSESAKPIKQKKVTT
jgi:hypothetical protein